MKKVVFLDSNHIQIKFSDTVDISKIELSKTLALYTEGDTKICTYDGFTTVYSQEGQTIVLSNDGSVEVSKDEY